MEKSIVSPREKQHFLWNRRFRQGIRRPWTRRGTGGASAREPASRPSGAAPQEARVPLLSGGEGPESRRDGERSCQYGVGSGGPGGIFIKAIHEYAFTTKNSTYLLLPTSTYLLYLPTSTYFYLPTQYSLLTGLSISDLRDPSPSQILGTFSRDLRTFSFPDSRDLLEVLGGLSLAERESPKGGSP